MERGEGFTQPSPERKIHVERSTPPVDAPISHVVPSARAPSLSSLRVAGKEKERERVLSISRFRFVEKKLPRN